MTQAISNLLFLFLDWLSHLIGAMAKIARNGTQ
jgi:hypothetical protein